MQFTAQTSSNGVVERSFTLGEIPGVLWSPASGSEHTPLVLMGHGGGLHKKAPKLVERAHHYVTTCGFAVAVIDAPGHGDRPRNTQDEQWVAALRAARAAGQPIDTIVIDYNSSLAERAVPEWQATLDAIQELPEIGTEAPVGYAGMTLATAIGVPLTAIEPRITAALFGGAFAYEALFDAARRVTIPIQILVPWDDDQLEHHAGLALFDAFASTGKDPARLPGRPSRGAVVRGRRLCAVLPKASQVAHVFVCIYIDILQY